MAYSKKFVTTYKMKNYLPLYFPSMHAVVVLGTVLVTMAGAATSQAVVQQLADDHP